MDERYALDTAAGFIIILKSALLPGWESEVVEKVRTSRLSDENCRPLSLGQGVWLTVWFDNTIYRVKFIVAERLVVEVIIICTASLKHHVHAITWTEQRIRLEKGEITIVKQLNGSSQEEKPTYYDREWTLKSVMNGKGDGAEDGEEKGVLEPNDEDKRNQIRLCRREVVPGFSQGKIPVTI